MKKAILLGLTAILLVPCTPVIRKDLMTASTREFVSLRTRHSLLGTRCCRYSSLLLREAAEKIEGLSCVCVCYGTETAARRDNPVFRSHVDPGTCGECHKFFPQPF